MSKRDPMSQAQKLDEKIKEMQERKRKYITKAQREIGEYLMTIWDIEDIGDAKKVIDALQDNAKRFFDNETETNENDAEASSNVNG